MVQQTEDQYGTDEEPLLFRPSDIGKIQALPGLQVVKALHDEQPAAETRQCLV